MKQTIDAVYAKGVFKPVKRPDVAKGQQVRLTITTAQSSGGPDLVAMAAKVLEGLSAGDIREFEMIALDRKPFFRKR